MALSLGNFKRSEAVRLPFDIVGATPTGTPTVTIIKGAATILAATSMTQGSDTSQWYHDYTVDVAATVGSYLVIYSAVVDGETLRSTDAYKVSLTDIDDVPTAAEIDTELSSTHGSTSWQTGLDGTGIYNATINVKDDAPANVPDAKVSVHNSNDDDLPVMASGITDAQGDLTLNLNGDVYVRVRKSGFNFTSTAKSITASGTYNVTGTATSITAPADPDLCRLYIFPVTLDAQDVTGLKIYISSTEKLTKVNGEFIKNTGADFTYDDSTDPDSYYFDALQGAEVKIKCDYLGIDHEVTVPALATQDLDDLIT